jgi:uncharacterized protein YegP (UPF0339 family)
MYSLVQLHATQLTRVASDGYASKRDAVSGIALLGSVPITYVMHENGV